MMQKLAVLAAVVALGGCAGVASKGFEQREDGFLAAEPRPVLSGQYDDEEAFINFGARAGVVLFGATTDPVTPRLTVGAYGRMLEDEEKRIEVAFEFTPDLGNIDRSNLYVMLSGDYVGFISDLLYWKAGVAMIPESQGDKKFFIFAIEGGVGAWFAVGEEDAGTAAVANLMLQLPVAVAGGDANAKIAVAITGGYEF